MCQKLQPLHILDIFSNLSKESVGLVNIEKQVKEVVELADQKKALHVTVYKPHDTSVTDFIVIMGVQNPIHAKSLLQEIDKCMTVQIRNNGEGVSPRMSGDTESGWMILDSGVMIVHVISESIRDHYQLDEWFSKRAVVYHI